MSEYLKVDKDSAKASASSDPFANFTIPKNKERTSLREFIKERRRTCPPTLGSDNSGRDISCSFVAKPLPRDDKLTLTETFEEVVTPVHFHRAYQFTIHQPFTVEAEDPLSSFDVPDMDTFKPVVRNSPGSDENSGLPDAQFESPQKTKKGKTSLVADVTCKDKTLFEGKQDVNAYAEIVNFVEKLGFYNVPRTDVVLSPRTLVTAKETRPMVFALDVGVKHVHTYMRRSTLLLGCPLVLDPTLMKFWLDNGYSVVTTFETLKVTSLPKGVEFQVLYLSESADINHHEITYTLGSHSIITSISPDNIDSTIFRIYKTVGSANQWVFPKLPKPPKFKETKTKVSKAGLENPIHLSESLAKMQLNQKETK